jgi:hypothetical protein
VSVDVQSFIRQFTQVFFHFQLDFANRAAAQADMHGGEGHHRTSGWPANDTSRMQQWSGPTFTNNHHPWLSSPHITCGRTVMVIEAITTRVPLPPMSGAIGTAHNEEKGLSEADARIAAIKAQKKRDRESSLALKEMQLKQY